jgi:hypothetical protein
MPTDAFGMDLPSAPTRQVSVGHRLPFRVVNFFDREPSRGRIGGRLHAGCHGEHGLGNIAGRIRAKRVDAVGYILQVSDGVAKQAPAGSG